MLPIFFCRLLPAGYLKCTHMHAHTKSLPSGQAIFKKNVYICRHIFSVVLCIHMHTLFFLLSQFRRHSSAAGIPTKIPLSRLHRLQPYIFLHLFFFVSPNDRQRWQLRKILHKTKQEEKSCKRKRNKHPLQFHQDKEQRGNRRTKKHRKNIKIKEFAETKKDVFVNQPRFSPHVDKKQKKNKEKQRVNKDKYTKIYKFYFQIKKIEKMDILQEQNEKKIKK